MLAEKSLSVLKDAFDEKERTRRVEALAEVSQVVAEAQHLQDLTKDGIAALVTYDSSLSNVSFAEGVRVLVERINEYTKELQLIRALREKEDDALTSAKVALVESVTADHRWHPPEERCPHNRCVALNKIEALRGD